MGTIGRYISVIASWMLTLTSFLEVLCKIVALPDPIAKTLFGIFWDISNGVIVAVSTFFRISDENGCPECKDSQ